MAIASTPSASLPDRMLRAARLNVPLYEEVEADTTATTQALTVVVLVALATGISNAITGASSGNIVGALLSGIIGALIGWAIWSFVIYIVGTRLFGGVATYGEVLRTLGFAETPLILSIVGFIPILGGIIGLVAFIWALVAGFIGTRQALDISNGKTVGTIVVALCAVVIVIAILAAIFGTIFGLGMLVGGAARP